MIEVSTDKEIYQAVMAAQKEQEGGNISGGDDDDLEDTPAELYPTYRKIFQAVSTLVRCVEHDGDPVSRKVEDVLASFAYHTRSKRSWALTTTHITDHFQCT